MDELIDMTKYTRFVAFKKFEMKIYDNWSKKLPKG